jgi:hypothetical protein
MTVSDRKGKILMSKRIGVSVVSGLAAVAVALSGATASTAREITKVNCSYNCPDIYQPVSCDMSDGSTMTFANRCYAGRYACLHGLTIVSCRTGV